MVGRDAVINVTSSGWEVFEAARNAFKVKVQSSADGPAIPDDR